MHYFKEIPKVRIKLILQTDTFRLRTNRSGQLVLTDGKRPMWPARSNVQELLLLTPLWREHKSITGLSPPPPFMQYVTGAIIYLGEERQCGTKNAEKLHY